MFRLYAAFCALCTSGMARCTLFCEQFLDTFKQIQIYFCTAFWCHMQPHTRTHIYAHTPSGHEKVDEVDKMFCIVASQVCFVFFPLLNIGCMWLFKKLVLQFSYKSGTPSSSLCNMNLKAMHRTCREHSVSFSAPCCCPRLNPTLSEPDAAYVSACARMYRVGGGGGGGGGRGGVYPLLLCKELARAARNVSDGKISNREVTVKHNWTRFK